MSTRDHLIDAASRRAVFVQRFAKGLEQEHATDFTKVLEKIAAKVERDYYEAITPQDLSLIIDGVSQDYDVFIKQFIEDLKQELFEFSQSDAQFNADLFGGLVSAEIQLPSSDDLADIFIREKLEIDADKKLSISDSIEIFGRNKTESFKQIVRDGYTTNETSEQVVAKLRDVIPVQARHLRSLVRTSTNATSSATRYASIFRNRDIFDGFEWVSTLDGRTSLICMNRDGNTYQIAESSPLPPAHWGCRSTIIPKIKSKYNLFRDLEGDRPASGGNGREKVSGRTTYSGWLSRQPATFQDEVLGEARGRLLRNGGLTLDKFIDTTGRTYTLQELEHLNPLAFEQANIN